MADGNSEPLFANTDPLNVLGDVVPPLSDKVMKKIVKGRTKRTQILDGSMLPQHSNLTPYALTHVQMNFGNEDDLVKCARMLQWSDARMRAITDPHIMWEWKKSFRDGMILEFSVGWYSQEFFEQRRDAFRDQSHSSYYSNFGLTPSDIITRDEIL